MPHDLHPQGIFEAVIEEHGYQSANTGTESLAVKFSTEHGPVWGRFWLTDKAIQKTIESIRAMGFEGNDLGELADGNCLAGYTCKIEVAYEQYGGQTRARVSWVHPVDYEPGLRRDEGVAANVRRFNALLKAVPVNAAGKPAGAAAATEGDDDDDSSIPF